jgi:glyoxalase family protein
MTSEPGLVPELSVTDYEASRHFWCDLVGFSLRYERLEEGFGYLVLGNAHLMLDQISLGRTWETGPLELPLGRGINFEVQVDNLDPALQRIISAGWPIFVEPEEKWYRAGDIEIGVRQFLVQDPDGYLLRLQQEIGERPVRESARSKQ